ncbi:unnamed protein product [Mytilus coruscus]|uniref:Ig-like domain-containing protein n=1 Tax=Mytilus coruscus TaxID=42192 RepID=A0A6J8F4Q8_MYTCO|nr:unnamed protein product [Mytilus coruscus]
MCELGITCNYQNLGIAYKILSSENETYGTKGSQINLTFTLNKTQSFQQPFRLDEDAVKYIFQFNLMIKKASTEDDGIYDCFIVIPWIDIVVAPIRFLYQTDDNILYGQEERAMNISCETVPGHTQEKLSIKHNGTTLTASKSNTVTFTFIPDRHDNFKEYECVGGQVFPLVRVTLLVNYAPDVQVIARKHSLDCIATGLPQTYTFKKWDHQSEQGEHVRFLNGLHNGTLNLKMLKLKYQISGIYICTVSNGIPDVNGSLFQMGFTSLQYTGHSIFASENRNVKVVQLYKPITLTFLLYSDPIVEEIRMKGVAADHEKNETILEFRLSGTDLMYTESGQKGKIKGYKISFDFKMFSSDYEMYNIWARNERGEDSFSFKIQAIGEPIFAPENRNVKHGELGQPLILTFVLYSNPIMEDIWIESVSTGNNQAKTKEVFNISNRTLPYTVFGNKGNISGYEIIFETKILTSNDFHEYNMWAKNKLGVDFYRFEIIEMGSLKNKGKDKTRFITSTCIAAGLLVYVIIVHICSRVKQISLCSKQSTTLEELHYHTYDEIGSMSNQTTTIRFSVVDQPGPSQQTTIVQSSQTAFSPTDINNQLPFNDRPESSSRVFPPENLVNAVHQHVISEEPIDVSSAISDENTRHSYMSCIEEGDISPDGSLQSFQRRRNRSEHSSFTNETSTCSTDSEESKIDSLNTTSVDINVGDGYENPYQTIMQEIHDTHQYSSIIQPVEQIDVTDYVNLRF